MQKPLLIVKNITHEGPGLLEELLQNEGIASRIEDLSRGGTFPDPRDYRAVIVLGGPQSANDETPAMQLQLQQINTALNENIPYLGICLGMQTLVKAGGGRVMKCPEKEIGFTDNNGNPYGIELTAAGQHDPLFAGLKNRLTVFQLHGETVELAPSGMELLASGHLCHNQAVKVGTNAYGLQCHFEMTSSMFLKWMTIDGDLKRMNHKTLIDQFEACREEYTATGTKLMNNFLGIASFI
ncbi:MAG: type 1 glutamine amidotransferase [Chlorobium sp.]|nr:MAG: type 1 glutamine amidotransferase [Chlorobium sp.]